MSTVDAESSPGTSIVLRDTLRPCRLTRAAIAGLGIVVMLGLAPQSAPLLIRHASLVDVQAGRVLVDHAVLVQGDRIERVGPDAELEAAAPNGAVRIDAGGRHLIPGLWDMHVHALWDPIVTTTVLPLMLTQGVTGMRDMGGTLAVLQQVRGEIGAARCGRRASSRPGRSSTARSP